DRPVCRRPASGRHRPSAGKHQARPRLERGRGAQAAGEIFRGQGSERPDHGRRLPQAVLDPVLVKPRPVSGSYGSIGDLPRELPVFPLTGVLLLPRGRLPLNIFEKRYLAMFDDAIGGDRLIGMIQPSDPTAGDMDPPLYSVGCAGRITSFNESGDGRYLVALYGVARFRIVEELALRRG